MHWEEVAVFDDNALSLGIGESELMQAAGDSLAAEASATVSYTHLTLPTKA